MKFLHPKFYPTWCLLFLLWLTAHLPFVLQRLLSYVFGFLLYYLLPSRRHIAWVNIQLCFSDKNLAQQKQLLKAHFKALGMNVVAIANSFYLNKVRTLKICHLQGVEHLDQALRNNQAIILLSGHWTSMPFAGCVVAKTVAMGNIFRPQNNALFDKIMRKNFTKKGIKMIASKDTKSMIRTLKSGMPIWYTHDQDLGVKHSIFAPFFGTKTATITATAKLAKSANATVLPVMFYFKNGYYIFKFSPPLVNYPSGDFLKDATLTNRILEQQIKCVPEQYFWVHRRFKTRPIGEKDPYL